MTQLGLLNDPGRGTDEGRERVAGMLARYLGPTVVAALEDDDVTEIYANPQDGVVRLDTRSRGRIASDEVLPAHRIEMFLNAVAANVGATLTADNPRLEAELPLDTFRGSRLQGFVPPAAGGPTFVVRKPPTVVYSLDEYVVAGVLTTNEAAVLRDAVIGHLNVLVAGSTNSGKTTLANTLLREISERCPRERVIILEDTVELRCASPDHLALRTNTNVTLADLVRSALRATPSRIVVGEVRGAEALDLLDAWATGHAGNVATVHASSAEGALRRLDRLAQRANVPPQATLVAEAVHIVVVLAGAGSGGPPRRRVTELARLDGLTSDGRYALSRLTEAGTWLPE